MNKKFEAMKEILMARRKKANDASRTNINKTRETLIFNEGDLVLSRDLTIATDQGGALKAKFKGPHIITKINEDNNTCIIQDINTSSTKKSHFQHLRKFTGPVKNITLPKDWDTNVLQQLNTKQTTKKGRSNVTHRPVTRASARQAAKKATN